jgi:hypothetical protein
MSRGDIVESQADIPNAVVQPLVDDFKSNNFNLKQVVRAIYLHDDFVRF